MSQYLDKDGASRIAENFLSKQAEQDAILKNLQFDLKEAEHALVKTIQGPAPLNIRALTRPLDDYLISGNTLQDGTPTPEAPVDVVGCGARTENLFDGQLQQGFYAYVTGNYTLANTYVCTHLIPCTDNTTYTFRCINTGGGSKNYGYVFFDSSQNRIGSDYINMLTVGDVVTHTATTPQNTAFLAINIAYGRRQPSVVRPSDITGFMLNTGSTALPYEPYGYKLPLTVNGTEYPIYLGQVPTTRRIKKLVLDGMENWKLQSINSYGIANFETSFTSAAASASYRFRISSHFVSQNTIINDTKTEGFLMNTNNVLFLRLDSEEIDTPTKLKNWLAAEYTNGTPVVVWYVLATPETGIVNEPLNKIGDYADTISMAQSGVEISTTKGFNTITTDTTVLSSNIEVKGVINNA